MTGPEPNPDGTNFDLCSGSLISNKHILTSAECVLINKNDKIYNEPENLLVALGDSRRRAGSLMNIKHIEPHEKAFTDGYSYNIGKQSQPPTIHNIHMYVHSLLLQIE